MTPPADTNFGRREHVTHDATADVVIIGGGIVGCATAYALTHAANPPRRVVIVERDPSYREASTPRSAGGIRQQFSTPENIALSQATLGLLAELKGRFGADADVSFREQGYLVLAGAEGEQLLRRNADLQRLHGAETAVLDAAQLADRFPWLDRTSITAGSFGVTGEGWIDPVALMTLLRKAAVGKGCEIVHAAVTGFGETAGRISTVELSNGARLSAGAVVIAAGPWSGAVARLAGLPLPVEPRKRYVYVVDCRAATEALHRGPLTVDTSGVWFRPEGRQFICGVSPSEPDEPLASDLDHIDYEPYETIVWPALAARVPAFESLKVTNAWAGYYDYNTLDQNAIIGRAPTHANLYIASGFSGHGLQQAYAAGRAIAELVSDGRFTTVDLARFSYDRVAANRPLFELNVI
jgi:FAD-dependent oxidoreductase domain-containing protein 1